MLQAGIPDRACLVGIARVSYGSTNSAYRKLVTPAILVVKSHRPHQPCVPSWISRRKLRPRCGFLGNGDTRRRFASRNLLHLTFRLFKPRQSDWNPISQTGRVVSPPSSASGFVTRACRFARSFLRRLHVFSWRSICSCSCVNSAAKSAAVSSAWAVSRAVRRLVLPYRHHFPRSGTVGSSVRPVSLAAVADSDRHHHARSQQYSSFRTPRACSD